MTEDQWAYLEAYVLDVARRMGLGHWRFIFDRDPCEDGHYAECSVSSIKWEVRLQFKRDLATRTPAALRETIVHELLHVHTADIVDALTPLRENIGPGAIWAAFYHLHDKAEERAVDAITQVIAPFMPVCEIPSEDVRDARQEGQGTDEQAAGTIVRCVGEPRRWLGQRQIERAEVEGSAGE